MGGGDLGCGASYAALCGQNLGLTASEIRVKQGFSNVIYVHVWNTSIITQRYILTISLGGDSKLSWKPSQATSNASLPKRCDDGFYSRRDLLSVSLADEMATASLNVLHTDWDHSKVEQVWIL